MTNDEIHVLARFLKDWDDHHPNMIVAYLAGMDIEIPEETAQKALEAGAIELLDEDGEPIDLDALDDEDDDA